MTESGEIMARISRKLLENIEQRLDEGGVLEVKDYKAVTGALKEIKELGRDEERKDEAIVVKFLGEAEEYAR